MRLQQWCFCLTDDPLLFVGKPKVVMVLVQAWGNKMFERVPVLLFYSR